MQITLSKQKVKKMAQLLKEFHTNAPKPCTLAQCYETVAKLFDCKDWNTLSALLPESAKDINTKTLVKHVYFEAENISPMSSSPEYAIFRLNSTILAELQNNIATTFSIDVTSHVSLSWETFGLSEKPELIKANLRVGPANHGTTRTNVEPIKNSFTDSVNNQRELYFDIEAENKFGIFHIQSYTFPLSALAHILKDQVTAPKIEVFDKLKQISWGKGTFITPSTWSATKEYLETSLAFMPMPEESYQELRDLLETQNDES